MYGYFKHVRGMKERIIRSLMNGLGPGYYHRAALGSNFNVETLEVEVKFLEKDHEEDRMRAIAAEYGIDEKKQEEEVDHPRVVIEFADPRTVTLLGAIPGGNTYAAGSGPTKYTDGDASSGASTVNKDCPVRMIHQHKKRALENSLLKW